MAKKFISELKEGDQLQDVFFVSEKVLATGKTGKPYLSLKLSDKTGTIDGRVWDKVEMLNTLFDREDFVHVKGSVQLYQGVAQLVIGDIKKVNDLALLNMDDFIPESGKDLNQLWSEFLRIGKSIKEPFLSSLFTKVFIEDRDVAEKLKVYPAAKSLHHAYKGGLLEHTLNIAKLAELVCNFYGDMLNRDILIFSALFHDIGKIRELSFSFATNYTDEGRLLGHIILADELLVKKAAEIPNFPPQLLNILRHILISHHGEYEFGSPKKPKTLEALVIHFLDNLDAKLNGFILAVDKDAQPGDWTSVVKAFDRQLYKAKPPTTEAKEQPQSLEKNQANRPKGFNPVLKNFSFELFQDKE
ncbi:MAG: HD domain-containing protein [bacterium]